ncbi:hypothetical protein FDZ74_10990 [bacterium]|nr:MAG: hypothetical protein FDZ74_10990 [bacterium]
MTYIRKTLNGKWQAVITLGCNEDGKRIIKHVTKNTKKECQKAAWEIEQAFKMGGRMPWQA